MNVNVFDNLTKLGPKWYIVQTRLNHENKVKTYIEQLVANKNLSDIIFDVQVPTRTKIEHTPTGKEKIVIEKIHPSYVFIKMIMSDQAWHYVRYVTGVTSFVGPGGRPSPLSNEEVKRMGLDSVIVEPEFTIGDEVEIINHQVFAGYKGKISDLAEGGDATVIVSAVGRDLPVILPTSAIRKI